jgi:hypothetical protein
MLHHQEHTLSSPRHLTACRRSPVGRFTSERVHLDPAEDTHRPVRFLVSNSRAVLPGSTSDHHRHRREWPRFRYWLEPPKSTAPNGDDNYPLWFVLTAASGSLHGWRAVRCSTAGSMSLSVRCRPPS